MVENARGMKKNANSNLPGPYGKLYCGIIGLLFLMKRYMSPLNSFGATMYYVISKVFQKIHPRLRLLLEEGLISMVWCDGRCAVGYVSMMD